MAKTSAKVIAFMRKQFKINGTAAEQALLEVFSEDERAVYLESEPGDWIDLEISGAMIEKAAPLLFAEPADPIYTFGKMESKAQMEGLYKIMMRIANVSLVLNQTPRIWSTYYNRGAVTTQRDETTRSVMFIVREFPELPAIHRKKVAGFLCGVLEMVGVSKPNCRLTGVDPGQWVWTADV